MRNNYTPLVLYQNIKPETKIVFSKREVQICYSVEVIIVYLKSHMLSLEQKIEKIYEKNVQRLFQQKVYKTNIKSYA